MKEIETYAVYVKMHPNPTSAVPDWVMWAGWSSSIHQARWDAETAKRYERFAAVKIVKRTETFEDVERVK